MEEKIKVSGQVEIRVFDKFGSLVIHRSSPNLVVSGGQNLFASLMGGLAVDPPSHVGVGSSDISPAKSQTALIGTEHERVAGDVSVTANVITITAELGVGIASEVACAEFGIFNAAAAGTMIARWTTPEFDLPATSTIEVIWKLTIGG